ncbi:extensin family protein [Chelatococcus sambhunathii]|uniref:Extensin family protein n=1 Tax=Chelatococcus sambhunathii TaxID=363953 RepID=A0ABU1DDF9_9HYPH|nr:extensin family protein [Chelatococcus sambhunathii]MDR4306100.1 extensin family protein [Chelatococcus sambhunathii]
MATALCAAGLLSAGPSASAPRPQPLAALISPAAEPAQFRFPWEQRPKAKSRGRRATKSQRPRTRKPAAAKRDKARPAAPAPAAADPLDAALPPATGPLDVAPPRGATRREADGWALVAGQAPAPADPPRLSEDGPASAPAYVLALLARMRVGDQTTAAVRSAAVEPEVETPDRHIPLPPMRPPAQDEAPRVEGLAPEGEGLAPEGNNLTPEGQALAPEGVPLPPRRPGDASAGDLAALEPEAPQPPPGPTAPDIALPNVPHEEDADCRALADEGVADADRIPPIDGPGVCGGGPLVLLKSVKRPDGGEIRIHPAATLRCAMARELAAFVRDDVAGAAQASELQLKQVDIAGSFQCRGRNGAAGGKMSEHGRANAVDVSGFAFADGKSLGVFAPELPKPMTDRLKASACGRFSTVLGPGSDGHHETHLHLDLQPRRSKSKLCQWDEPEVARAKEDEDGDHDGDEAKTSKPSAEGETEPKAAGRNPEPGEAQKKPQAP